MLKFLVDENIGQSTIRYLKEKGYDVVVVAEKELSGREDRFFQESPSLKISALDTIISKGFSQILNHFIVASEEKIRSRIIQQTL